MAEVVVLFTLHPSLFTFHSLHHTPEICGTVGAIAKRLFPRGTAAAERQAPASPGVDDPAFGIYNLEISLDPEGAMVVNRDATRHLDD